MGDRMTAISDQADVAPSLMPIPTGGMPRNDVGDDWEEQQRRWAGGRAPVAAGPKSVEDFSEIEEAAAGVQADRCDCARAHAQAHTHTHTHTAADISGARQRTRAATTVCARRSACTSAGARHQAWAARAGAWPTNSFASAQTCVCAPQIRLRGCAQYARRRAGAQLRRRQLPNGARSSATRRLARFHVLSRLPRLVQVPSLPLSLFFCLSKNTQCL